MGKLKLLLVPALLAINIVATIAIGARRPAPPATGEEVATEQTATSSPPTAEETEERFAAEPLPTLQQASDWIRRDPAGARARLEKILKLAKGERPAEERLGVELALAYARYLEGDPGGAIRKLGEATETVKSRISIYQLAFDMDQALQARDGATAALKAYQLLLLQRRYEEAEPQFTRLAHFAVATGYELQHGLAAALCQSQGAGDAAKEDAASTSPPVDAPAAVAGSPIRLARRPHPDPHLPDRVYDLRVQRASAEAVLQRIADESGLPLQATPRTREYLRALGVSADVEGLLVTELVGRVAGAVGFEAEVRGDRIVVTPIPRDPAKIAARAKTLYRQYIIREPEGVQTEDAFLAIANIDYEAGRYEDALVTYESYVQRFPDAAKLAQALTRVGLCYAALGDHQKARRSYRQVVRHSPETPEAEQAELLIAGSFEVNGDLEKAMESLKRVRDIALSEKVRIRTLIQLAELQHRTGAHEPATRTYEEALKAGATGAPLARARLGAARCHRELGHLADAAKRLSVLVAEQPTSRLCGRALLESALALNQANEPLRALVSLGLVRRRYLKQVQPSELLALEGDTYRRLGLVDRSIAAWKGALEAGGTPSDLPLLLGRALRDAHRYAEARAAFERALRTPRRAPEARLEIARTFLAEGSYRDALQVATGALAIGPGRHAQALRRVAAKAQANLGQLRDAARALLADATPLPAKPKTAPKEKRP